MRGKVFGRCPTFYYQIGSSWIIQTGALANSPPTMAERVIEMVWTPQARVRSGQPVPPRAGRSRRGHCTSVRPYWTGCIPVGWLGIPPPGFLSKEEQGVTQSNGAISSDACGLEAQSPEARRPSNTSMTFGFASVAVVAAVALRVCRVCCVWSRL